MSDIPMDSNNTAEMEICAICGNPRWATCHVTSLNTAAMRDEFIGFHEFKHSDTYIW